MQLQKLVDQVLSAAVGVPQQTGREIIFEIRKFDGPEVSSASCRNRLRRWRDFTMGLTEDVAQRRGANQDRLTPGSRQIGVKDVAPESAAL